MFQMKSTEEVFASGVPLQDAASFSIRTFQDQWEALTSEEVGTSPATLVQSFADAAIIYQRTNSFDLQWYMQEKGIARLGQRLKDGINELGLSDMSNVLFGYSVFDCKIPGVIRAPMMARAAEIVSSAEAKDLARFLDKLTYSDLHPGDTFLQGAALRMKEVLPEMRTKQQARSLRAFSYLGEQLTPSLCYEWWRAAKPNIDSFENNELSVGLWSYTVQCALAGQRKMPDAVKALSSRLLKAEETEARNTTLNQASIWFGLPSLARDAARPDTKSPIELELVERFKSAGATIKSDKAHYLGRLASPVDCLLSYKRKNMIIEVDGKFHYVTHPDGKKTLNGSTLLQTANLRILAPEIPVLRLPVAHNRFLYDACGYDDRALLRDFADVAPGAYTTVKRERWLGFEPIDKITNRDMSRRFG